MAALWHVDRKAGGRRRKPSPLRVPRVCAVDPADAILVKR